MKDYYYCLDGVTVNGPLSAAEIRGLLDEQTLTLETLLCCAGEKEWTPLKAVQLPEREVAKAQDLSEKNTTEDKDVAVDHQAVAKVENDADDEPDEDKGYSKSGLLAAIRKDLDLLWRAQREALISEIKSVELDREYETTRKEAKLIKRRVVETTLLYWQKSKLYDQWIADLVWRDCDLQRKLRGEGCEQKYEDAKRWLENAKLLDKAGCYCFRNGKDYLYIGKAGSGDASLGSRLHAHRRSVYFENATHLRVIVPRHKAWIGKLERLLLLAHPDSRYNDATPDIGNNPADNTLALLDKEMNDLLVDG